MGASHARAYHKMSEFNIVGLVSRGPESRARLSDELGGLPQYDNFTDALAATQPDAVSINTYPDTHAAYALQSLEAGAHVFVEKPLASTVEEAEAIVAAAGRHRRKLVVGYILRVHPAWKKFIDLAQAMGKPLVMRMNLNQQSDGEAWYAHRQLMKSISPIVDCGVHYVDVMCQMTQARPVRVSGIGARLSDEIADSMYNYGQLQVTFDDGSVGWYEAGWGPMMSETAFFVKDAIGPKGSVSIVNEQQNDSDDIDAHTRTNQLRVHYAERNEQGAFTRSDELVSTADEPDHQGLCDLEQTFFYQAIANDQDLSQHHADAINSLRVVLAADKSFKTGKTVTLV